MTPVRPYARLFLFAFALLASLLAKIAYAEEPAATPPRFVVFEAWLRPG